MKLAIMQPYFLPYIGYFQLMSAVDEFVIYDDVNYIKNGWINRNAILLNEKRHTVTIPIHQVSPFKKINDHLISPDSRWKKKMVKTITQTYKKAPFYESTISLVEEVINFEEENISKYLNFSLVKIADYLKLNTKIIPTSSCFKNQELSGQRRVLDICQKQNCKEYINLIGGFDLYQKEIFRGHNIQLHFLKGNENKYLQFHGEFVPNLSIVDVLMFNSLEAIDRMLKSYTLI